MTAESVLFQKLRDTVKMKHSSFAKGILYWKFDTRRKPNERVSGCYVIGNNFNSLNVFRSVYLIFHCSVDLVFFCNLRFREILRERNKLKFLSKTCWKVYAHYIVYEYSLCLEIFHHDAYILCASFLIEIVLKIIRIKVHCCECAYFIVQSYLKF